MLASLLRVAGIGLAAYVLVCVLVWRYQDRLAFPAPRSRLPTPAERGLGDGERIAVRTRDGVELYGWYLPPAPGPPTGARAPGLIWFYGNAETVAAIAPILHQLRPPGTALLVLDYRGYGESGSTPTETGIYRDADAAWEYLSHRAGVDPDLIAVYGRSVGAVLALYLATTRPVSAVVLDSPFTTARAMAARHYWWLPRFLIRLSLDNLTRASRLTVPLLVFHGADDLIAPLAMGRAIAAAGHGELVALPGAGHNETYDASDDAYRNRMWAFLARERSTRREEGTAPREE